MTKAVFLDRDGVLNRVVWRGAVAASPRQVGEFEIEPEAASAMAALKAEDWLRLVVTNQPDISRGLMTIDTLDAIHEQLSAAIAVDDISACTHDNHDGCDCRKPKPGLLTALAAKHGVDLAQSWMIGDQDRDIECGRAAGCRTVLLIRPYNLAAESPADYAAESLSQAIEYILAQNGRAIVS
jgi:D-glycero-D-manno-heptose 1,7-bisphosphate phosphatase